MKRRHDFSFRAPVEKHDFGRMAYHAVFVPEDILTLLPLAQYPRLRIDAEVGGLLTNCGLMMAKQRRYILLSAAFMKQAGLRFGDPVDVHFSIADQDRVDVPAELEEAIQRRARTREVWESLTPGKRRGLVHRVASAVRPETREQRVLEVLDQLVEQDIGGAKR